MANEYLDLKGKHDKEFGEFPCFFAFSKDQIVEGMEKLGVKDKSEIVAVPGNMFIKKTESENLLDLFKKHTKEVEEAIDRDKTGEGYIFDMFNYELANHEFCITHDTSYTLEYLGFTMEDIEKSEALTKGFNLAVKRNWNEE